VKSLQRQLLLVVCACAGNIKIDVSTPPGLPEPSLKTSSVVAAAAAADIRQPNTTGDVSPAGTAEDVTCNGTEVTVDVRIDSSGVQSSEEAGGMMNRYDMKFAFNLSNLLGDNDTFVSLPVSVVIALCNVIECLLNAT